MKVVERSVLRTTRNIAGQDGNVDKLTTTHTTTEVKRDDAATERRWEKLAKENERNEARDAKLAEKAQLQAEADASRRIGFTTIAAMGSAGALMGGTLLALFTPFGMWVWPLLIVVTAAGMIATTAGLWTLACYVPIWGWLIIGFLVARKLKALGEAAQNGT